MIGFVLCMTKFGKGEPILVRGATNLQEGIDPFKRCNTFLVDGGTDPMNMCNKFVVLGEPILWTCATHIIDTIYMWGTDPSTYSTESLGS